MNEYKESRRQSNGNQGFVIKVHTLKNAGRRVVKSNIQAKSFNIVQGQTSDYRISSKLQDLCTSNVDIARRILII